MLILFIVNFCLEGQDCQILHQQFCELFGRWTHVINRITSVLFRHRLYLKLQQQQCTFAHNNSWNNLDVI